MFVPFDSLSPSSRIWIYQAGKRLSQPEIQSIAGRLTEFTGSWTTHGAPLKASFDIRYDQFIILAADEGLNEASGCSIDDSARVMKRLEHDLGTKLFDRQQAAFLDRGIVIMVPLGELREKYSQGIWNEHTPAFNNLVAVKGQLDKEWIRAAGQTWLKRYLPVVREAT